MAYFENDLVIVSAGGVLPGASEPKRFFQNLLNGKTHIYDLRDSTDMSYRPIYSLIHSSDRSEPDTSYAILGADIPRRGLYDMAIEKGLDFSDSLPLHVMSVEAVDQCAHVLSESDLKKTDLIFGASDVVAAGALTITRQVFDDFMNSPDLRDLQPQMDACFQKEVSRVLERGGPVPPPSLSIPSQLAEKIRQRVQFGGMSFLVDAACASFFAALKIAQLRLQENLCDFAIVGSADDSVGSGSANTGFCQLGVISEEVPRPFDSRSSGIALGEAAVAFVVTTFAKAREKKLPILGVIRKLGGSSDGKSGGMTEPLPSGQKLCYENTYRGGKPDEFAYIECHGTGTKVGDPVELSALSEFFKDQTIPIGSVKYNVGHTLVAAGAVSLLKCLGVLEHKVIPPSSYFEKFPNGIESKLFLNREILKLKESSEPLNIGISSFGFGGTNFHLWLQEYKPAEQVMLSVASGDEPVLLCGQLEATVEQVPELFSMTKYNIPPKVWPWIDRGQILSVLLAEKMFRELGIRPQNLDSKNMHVITGVAQPLSLERELTHRGMTSYTHRLLKMELPEFESRWKMAYEQLIENLPEVNEQTIMGSINSLVAGRVSKAFDFHGLNFNIDGDTASGLKALEVARLLLRQLPGGALVFDAGKSFEPTRGYLKTTKLKCYLIATKDFAHAHNFPILGELGRLSKKGENHVSL